MNYFGNSGFNAFDMLVGRVGQAPPGAIMVPARPAPPLGMNPWGPGPCGPPQGYCPTLPNCAPQDASFYSRSAGAAIAAQATQAPLGISSQDEAPGTPIVAGGSRALTTTASVPYCITNIRVPRNVAPNFSFVSIRSSRQEWLMDGRPVPCDTYASDTTAAPGQFPMVFPGSPVTTTVRNDDGADHHFRGTFIGFPGPSCSPCL